MILLSIITILSLAFIYFSLIIFNSNKKIFSAQDQKNTSLSISVVVALKNESKNISSLIDSLKRLDYPQEKFEVIFVDDDSNDGSFSLIIEAAKGIPNFHCCKVENKILPGKKGTLTFGISKTINPFIMITDADCRPEKDWLKLAAGKFSGGFDLIFGAAPFYQDNSLTRKISCFENLRSSILTFGLAGINIYYSAAARNFGFKKETFEKIKGYSNTSETLSGDDDLLIREAVKNKLKIGMFTKKGSHVFSSSKKNLKDYFTQKARHTKTSFYYLPRIKAVLGLWHGMNLIFLLSIILCPISWLYLIPFFTKIFVDAMLVRKMQNYFDYNFSIPEIIYFQVIYEVILVINIFGAAFKKDKWK